MVVALKPHECVDRCKRLAERYLGSTFCGKLLPPVGKPMVPIPSACCGAVPASIGALHNGLQYVEVGEQQICAYVTWTKEVFDAGRMEPARRHQE